MQASAIITKLKWLTVYLDIAWCLSITPKEITAKRNSAGRAPPIFPRHLQILWEKKQPTKNQKNPQTHTHPQTNKQKTPTPTDHKSKRGSPSAVISPISLSAADRSSDCNHPADTTGKASSTCILCWRGLAGAPPSSRVFYYYETPQSMLDFLFRIAQAIIPRQLETYSASHAVSICLIQHLLYH